jgi:hypothetical protein
MLALCLTHHAYVHGKLKTTPTQPTLFDSTKYIVV